MSDNTTVQYGKTLYDALIKGLEDGLITVNEFRLKLGFDSLEEGDITKYEWTKAKNNGSRPKMTTTPFSPTGY